MVNLEIVGMVDKIEVKNKDDKTTIKLKGEFERIFDGYYTTDEIYSHRIILFIALMKSHKELSWKSRIHHDDSFHPNFFIAGMNLPSGTITYHIPNSFWGMLDDINTLDTAPEWDGHSSVDVISRINSWLLTMSEKL